jgi:hypothetical protein
MGNGTPNPLKISPPDLDRLIAGVSDKTTLEASVYISQGHPKWVIKCPTFCWEFDLGSQKWNERVSYLTTTWRAVGGCSAFGKWIVGDAALGRLLYIDATAYSELRQPAAVSDRERPGCELSEPHEGCAGRLQLRDGVGIATGSDPTDTHPKSGFRGRITAALAGAASLRAILARRQRPTTVTVYRTGMTGRQGRRWRLTVSAAVYVAFMGGTQSMELRRG